MSLDLTKAHSLVKLFREFFQNRTGVCDATEPAVLSNTADLANPGYFEVTGAGNVKFDPIEGPAGQTRAFDAKECSKFRVKRIYSTGTSATGIVIYY